MLGFAILGLITCASPVVINMRDTFTAPGDQDGAQTSKIIYNVSPQSQACQELFNVVEYCMSDLSRDVDAPSAHHAGMQPAADCSISCSCSSSSSYCCDSVQLGHFATTALLQALL